MLDSADADAAHSLVGAMERQLSLKPVPVRGSERVLVIDRIEKPSPN